MNKYMSDKFSSKANTLSFLQKKITKGKIENIFSFTVSEWKNNEKKIIKKIVERYHPNEIIVRSSAKGEDSINATEAGKYKSIQKISTKIKKDIRNSINEVIKSYIEKENDDDENQILVQKQTNDVITNGVVFTRTPENGSPYYVINFSDSKETDNVTKGEISKLVKIFRDSKNIPKKWNNLILAVREIEHVCKTSVLDIEFAITKSETVIFQVRPLVIAKKIDFNSKNERKIKSIIKKNQKKFEKFKQKSKIDNICFSDMADWNPAEIIGNNPNFLDYSLYDFLFMHNSWQKGRIKIGYNKENQTNLMERFGNKPYINVQKSFESLFPININKKIKKKLIRYYLLKLKNNPHLHDKIEFYIIFSCYDFSFNARKKELKEYGFDDNEIDYLKQKLMQFTNHIIRNFSLTTDSAMKDIEKMISNNKKIHLKINENSTSREYFTAAIKLLQDCKKYGAINFSSMARLAFIGNILLKSLNENKFINEETVNETMSSISSPLSEIQKDLSLVTKNNITKKEFLEKYGHLRPGTYDITAQRYDENPKFLENIKYLSKQNKKYKITYRKKLDAVLKNHGIEIDFTEFMEFLKNSIRLREVLKFEFTKNLSDSLLLISKGGKKLGFSVHEIANLSIKEIMKVEHMNERKIIEKWGKKIKNIQENKKITDMLILPPIIFSEKDFEIINYNISKPNFITIKQITAEIVKISNIKNTNHLEGKIIYIENADPGYDWIFTKNPAGLITKYGGVASHMAIRCAELGLPAAIGVGEVIFEKIENAGKILLDCENQQIIILETQKIDEYMEEKRLLKSLGYIK